MQDFHSSSVESMFYPCRRVTTEEQCLWKPHRSELCSLLPLQPLWHWEEAFTYKPNPPSPQVRKQLDMGKSIWGKIRTRPSPKPCFCYMCIYKSYSHNSKRLKPPAFQVLEVETLRHNHLRKTLSGTPCHSSPPWHMAHTAGAEQPLLLRHAHGWKSRWPSSYLSCIVRCMLESKRMLGIFW